MVLCRVSQRGRERAEGVGLNFLHFCDNLGVVADDSDFTPRRSERHPIRLALVLMMNSDEGEIRNEAVTVDVSQHGCRVEGVATLSEGQVIRLIPWESAGPAISGRVVWVGEPASQLAGEAGIEFLQPLSSVV
jgi:hypothetical protein